MFCYGENIIRLTINVNDSELVLDKSTFCPLIVNWKLRLYASKFSNDEPFMDNIGLMDIDYFDIIKIKIKIVQIVKCSYLNLQNFGKDTFKRVFLRSVANICFSLIEKP